MFGKGNGKGMPSYHFKAKGHGKGNKGNGIFAHTFRHNRIDFDTKTSRNIFFCHPFFTNISKKVRKPPHANGTLMHKNSFPVRLVPPTPKFLSRMNGTPKLRTSTRLEKNEKSIKISFSEPKFTPELPNSVPNRICFFNLIFSTFVFF